jgi:hypothetical protein
MRLSESGAITMANVAAATACRKHGGAGRNSLAQKGLGSAD